MSDLYSSLSGKDPIDSTKWPELDVVQLREQVGILSARLGSIESLASSINPQTLAVCRNSLQAAIGDIERIIATKQQPKPPGTV